MSVNFERTIKKLFRKNRSVKTEDGAKTEKKSRVNIAAVLSAAVLIICIAVIGTYFADVYEAKRTAEKLKDIYDSGYVIHEAESLPAYKEPEEYTETAVITEEEHEETAVPSETAVSEEETSEATTETEIIRLPLVRTPAAEEFLKINGDTVGYVKIPGVLAQVIVQYSDNEYYLKHNFYGSRKQCGTCFADYRCNVSDYPDLMSDNIVIYGHNQKDGSMFGNMDYYRWDHNYWKKNPFVYFSNNYEENTYVIIATFVTNAVPEQDNGNLFDYWNYINFGDGHSYDEFMRELNERSTIITGVDVQPTDKFITLQTCSTEWEDSRFVIVARKLRDEEGEASFSADKFQINPNPKWPAIYYKYYGGSYIE